MKINKMCIFDLDGTLDLTDGKLSAEIYRLSKIGVIFVTATGRTNSYVKETCKKYGIISPRFIIADNGGTIYDNINQCYIKRTSLPTDTREKILAEFVRLGGTIEEIRYTDGEYVYAAKTEDAERYYKKEKSVQYMENEEIMQAVLGEDSDITKVTLAGNKALMKDVSRYVKKNEIKCWTDMGMTAYPNKAKKNYRMDITDGQSSKGEAVEFLAKYTDTHEFTCIGNGMNDFSMFKYALDSGMPIVVVKNYENGKISKESEELISKVQEYARSIEREDKVSISTFPINGYIGRLEEQKSSRERRKGFIEKLKTDTVPKIDTTKKSNQRTIRKTQHKEEK